MMNRRASRFAGLFAGVAATVVALDLWSKHAVFALLDVRDEGEPPRVVSQKPIVVVADWFELEANYNYGAFSGWFSSHPEWLAALSVVALAVIVGVAVVHFRRNPSPSAAFVVALALLWGGTLGNLHDRLRLGAVRDWIKWFVVIDGRPRVWPNFNIADSAICTGVGLILLLEIRGSLRERRAARRAAERRPAEEPTPPSRR
jgi:signal peptidase II